MIGLIFIIIFIISLFIINMFVPFKITTIIGIILIFTTCIDEIFNLVIGGIFV